MKYAQVDVRQPAQAITGWTTSGQAILTPILNGVCIVDVQDAPYTVGEPLFWVDCAYDVQPWMWYYDTALQVCIMVPPPAPRTAAADQPVVDGAQTL